MTEILLVAAENSAENYCQQLLRVVREVHPDWHFFGVGGDKLRQLGMEVIYDNSELGIVGIVEVLSALKRLKQLKDFLLREVKRRNCRYALLVDYPDFNLKLAADLKKEQVDVFYYIPPTVWAWRYGRVKLLKQFCRHLFIIFPFEQEIYQREAIPFTLLQHPLLTNWPPAGVEVRTLKKEEQSCQEPLLALLPGSRRSEIKRLLPIFQELILLIKEHFPEARFALLKADGIPGDYFHDLEKDLAVQIVAQKDRYQLLSSANLALSSCGTATLEAALCFCPLIVLYRVNQLSYLLGINFIRISNYSIVNILGRREIAREFIQHNCRPEKIMPEVLRLLNDSDYRQQMLKGFAEVKDKLTQEIPAEEKIIAILEDYFKTGNSTTR